MLEGHSQYESFNKTFNEVVQNHRSEFEYLGISVEYFGTHPIRKGSATFVYTIFTLSTPKAYIWLHATWKFARVKDRYIKYEKTGYQFVGRAVTGLPMIKK